MDIPENKTAISFLAEFCAQQKAESPQYDLINSLSDPTVPIFTMSVTALGFGAVAAARSKIDAKHAASKNLIGKYKVRMELLLFRSLHFTLKRNVYNGIILILHALFC